MGGSALCLKDVFFKTRWIKNSLSFLSVPPLPPMPICKSWQLLGSVFEKQFPLFFAAI